MTDPVALQAEVEGAVTDFVMEHLLQGDGRGLEADSQLLELGILDSLNVITLLTFLQTRFAVDLSPDDLVPENIGSVAAIARWIAKVAD